MTLHAPQIIWLFFVLFTVGVDAERHGKERTGKHNFWISVLSAVLSIALLTWGGFFK